MSTGSGLGSADHHPSNRSETLLRVREQGPQGGIHTRAHRYHTQTHFTSPVCAPAQDRLCARCCWDPKMHCLPWSRNSLPRDRHAELGHTLHGNRHSCARTETHKQAGIVSLPRNKAPSFSYKHSQGSSGRNSLSHVADRETQ